MIVWSALLLLSSLTGGMDAAFAPDQALPHVYVGEPLILELRTGAAMSASVSTNIQSQDGVLETLNLGAQSLRDNEIRWIELPGLAASRGLYNAEVTFTGGETSTQAHVFCRIDRPAALTRPLPVGVMAGSLGANSLVALAGVYIPRIRLNASTAGVEEQLDAALALGLEVSLTLDAAVTPEPVVARLSSLYKGRVASWDFAEGAPMATLAGYARAIHVNDERANIGMIVTSPDAFVTAMEDGALDFLTRVIAAFPMETPIDLLPFRLAAEQRGYEGFPFGVLQLGVSPDPERLGAWLLQRLTASLAAGAVILDIDSAALLTEDAFTEGYVMMAACTRRLASVRYVGGLPLAGDVQAHAFIAPDGAWRLVAWTAGEPKNVTLDVGGVEGLDLADSRNNPLPTPEVDKSGRLSIHVSSSPVFLQGAKGGVVRQAAAARARSEANRFTANIALVSALPSEFVSSIRNISRSPSANVDRVTFFQLLRTFEYLERVWHRGELPRDVAAPSLAALSRLMRALCLLEQERGEPFVTLLQEPLAECAKQESQFLTQFGGGAKARQRGDWLLAEVGGLVEEARTLAAAGRTIEAVAIASMAEWRARSLTIASEAAPLTSESRDDHALSPPALVADSQPASTPEKTKNTVAGSSVVQSGDSAWIIAKRHGVTLKALMTANNWSAKTILRVGVSYQIPEGGNPMPAVQKTDTSSQTSFSTSGKTEKPSPSTSKKKPINNKPKGGGR